MKETTPIEYLDLVLDELYKHNNSNNINTIFMIEKYLEIRGYKLTEKFILSILKKLINEKYVSDEHIVKNTITIKNNENGNFVKKPLGQEPNYYITFDGEVFLKSGGYTQDSINKNSTNIRIAKMEKRMYWVNFWVAFGAVGLLLFEIFKFIVERLDLVWCDCI